MCGAGMWGAGGGFSVVSPVWAAGGRCALVPSLIGRVGPVALVCVRLWQCKLEVGCDGGWLGSDRYPFDEMAAFQLRHSGFSVRRGTGDRIVELVPASFGVTILLHPAAVSQREGQVVVKLVFDVEDVEAFCARARAEGLEFGTVQRGAGYVFANAKDPSKNEVQVSSRAFAHG